MPPGTATELKLAEIAEVAKRDGADSLVVLSGVPSTGKSFLALEAAQRLAKHPFFLKQIQFHQSYSYEDFIEGLRPNSSGGFESRVGIFLEWNEAALRDPGNIYVLLIEELSRANLPNVLGELMTYIEYRGRSFETPLTRRRIAVASNLVVIATMNPLDRSALEIDDALIRRLSIVDCPPSSDQLREMLGNVFNATKGNEKTLTDLAGLFDELQREHPATFAQAMPFGHGVFAKIGSEDDLYYLWEHRLRHLLRRPLAAPHPYADDIERLYRWKTKPPASVVVP
jgi:5-methylcytosine-specific restriction endonuclease McrBC GTP-binding regulatory subunit McrB